MENGDDSDDESSSEAESSPPPSPSPSSSAPKTAADPPSSLSEKIASSLNRLVSRSLSRNHLTSDERETLVSSLGEITHGDAQGNLNRSGGREHIKKEDVTKLRAEMGNSREDTPQRGRWPLTLTHQRLLHQRNQRKTTRSRLKVRTDLPPILSHASPLGENLG